MTDEQRAKIKWLNRAFHAEKKVNAWIAKYEHDKSHAERLSRCAENIGAGRSAGSGNSTEDSYMQLAETREKVDELEAWLKVMRKEIENAIDTIGDDDMESILVRHFLNYETFDTVAIGMGYGRTTVMRKYKEALDKLVLNGTP